MSIIVKHIQRAFSLTRDLVENLEDSSLKLNLAELPSNTIAEQLWCIIGARESYFKAIKQGSWQGFSCSLKDATSQQEILSCLDSSSGSYTSYLEDATLDDTQLNFLIDILEHEIQHHGQLIRYVYGNKLKFPKSWNERYTV